MKLAAKIFPLEKRRRAIFQTPDCTSIVKKLFQSIYTAVNGPPGMDSPN